MTKSRKKIKWTEALLVETFKLNRLYENPRLLEEWLDVQIQFSETEISFLEEIRDELLRKVDFWNEEELKMNFIALLLNVLVKYKNDKYQTYFDKEISAEVEDIFLKTEAYFMIAKGIMDIPKNPYFCFHEYKREKKTADDPIAQVLLAFLIAQSINQDNKPLYGCYVVGKYWDFMLMESKSYIISQSFDATKREDLMKIIAVLRKFKVILETQLLD